MSRPMPAIFAGHGNPMNALLRNEERGGSVRKLGVGSWTMYFSFCAAASSRGTSSTTINRLSER